MNDMNHKTQQMDRIKLKKNIFDVFRFYFEGHFSQQVRLRQSNTRSRAFVNMAKPAKHKYDTKYIEYGFCGE